MRARWRELTVSRPPVTCGLPMVRSSPDAVVFSGGCERIGKPDMENRGPANLLFGCDSTGHVETIDVRLPRAAFSARVVPCEESGIDSRALAYAPSNAVRYSLEA